MRNDPRAVLGVTSQASPEEIKKAYRRLAQKHHPDRHPGDPAAVRRFQEIQQAYERLRAAPAPEALDLSDVEDLFEQVFRQTQTASVIVMPLPLEIIAHGGLHVFDVDDPEPCTCPLFRRARCPLCHGTGVLRHRRHTYEVTVPPGVPEGFHLRARVKGHPGKEQIVRVQVAPHQVFHRQADDLWRPVDVPYPTLVLGGTLVTSGLDRAVTVTLPAGLRPGQTVRVQGLGLPRIQGGHGDLYLQVDVAIPDTLTAAQREALEHLAQVMTSP